jgi:hypothetical protein
MVGALGGNVSGITSSYGSIGDVWAYTMTEITENEYYTSSSYLYWYEDDNNYLFIDRYDTGPSLNVSFGNQLVYVLSNQPGFNKAFFNVAVDCATFSGYCATNNVTLSEPPGSTPVSTYTSGITINVTETGFIRYDTPTEYGKTQYFGSLGVQDIPDCADCSTIRIATPLIDLGSWTVVDCGSSCP